MNDAAGWIDRRLAVSRLAPKALRKAFPEQWSFLLGELALYAFAVLLLTGVILTLFYDPSAQPVIYEGSYAPLVGAEMSEAYRSVLTLSRDVQTGLLLRQTHHWAALVFVGAIVAHMCRVFFTGAYRRPREINWLVGIVLLVLALINGFAGYSLPDDLLAGATVRIFEATLLSLPVIGDDVASLVFGAPLDRETVMSRLFVLHVLIVPALLVAVISAHMAILLRQKHTQFGHGHRHERNVVGLPLWPEHAAKSGGLFFLVAALLVALGGLVEINPIWLRGPFDGTIVPSPIHPDWFQLWNSGALRLFPGWEPTVLGHAWPLGVFLPGVLFPALVIGLVALWPFLDRGEPGVPHHLLQRPRDHPRRTALGVAGLTLFVVLTAAGANDVLARAVDAPVSTVNSTLRWLLLIAPPVAGAIAYRWCRALVAAEVRRRGA